MAEAGVHAKFFKKAVLHGVKSKEAGRQIFVDKDYIEIRVVGNDKEVFVGPVTDETKARFPGEWDRYEKGAEQKREGTPISQWPQVTPSQVKQFENLNIWTVEDMATLSDSGLAELGMGARQLQNDARKFLSLAQGAADMARYDEMKAELIQKDEQIAALTRQVADILARLPAPEEKKTRKKAAEEVSAE